MLGTYHNTTLLPGVRAERGGLICKHFLSDYYLASKEADPVFNVNRMVQVKQLGKDWISKKKKGADCRDQEWQFSHQSRYWMVLLA